MPKGEGGPCVFYPPHFQMIRPNPLFPPTLTSLKDKKSIFFSFFKKMYDKAKKKISQQGRDISTVLRNSSPMII